MRPITLNSIIRILEQISRRKINHNELTRRQLELIVFLEKYKFIDRNDKNEIIVTNNGYRLLNAYKNKDTNNLHRIFYETINEYKIVYNTYIENFDNALKISEKTGLNIVITDTMIRLIISIEVLGKGHIFNDNRLTDLFISKYWILRKKYKLRYIKISDIEKEMKREAFIPRNLFNKLLEQLKKKENIIFVNKPYVGKDSGYIINGKRYVYVMIR